ncbi:MAG TPA: 30S ribosomal protein S2 [Candidatus Saccharimonadales bacterium]|nr:30S ribosomal protein S2 [Candidatus Saccharimonadales bacterium]
MATVDVDIKQLLEAGAHFGHKTSRWHPKMAQYIHSKRGGSHIIDLNHTVAGLEKALDFVANTVGEGKQVLFVATKRQAQDIVKQLAEDVKQPFVTERWLGGMLTNWPTISSRVKRLHDLEEKMASGELGNKYSKLEVQRFQEEIDRLNVLYGGIKNMSAKPGAVFIFDVVADVNAVKEARKLGLPIVALIDTNADPTLADYPVPSNDDAIKTIQLIADYAKQAVEAGAAKRAKATPAAEKADKDEATEEK